jgi:hypothetical protein
MSSFVGLEQCPRCAENGRDRHRDNLGVYSDGSSHCFSCGYHTNPRFALKYLMDRKEKVSDKEKAVLPIDFQRQIPTKYWQWLLAYGLPMSYWKAHCGYSEKEERLVFTVGNPIRFSVGRSLSVGDSKWKVYGDKSCYVEVVSEQLSDQVVLVEDIISAHKVGLVASTIPLFGTIISDGVVKKLQELNRPVRLWLDEDQYPYLAKKIGRLQALLGPPMSYIKTRKDPKDYSTEEIKEILS